MKIPVNYLDLCRQVLSKCSQSQVKQAFVVVQIIHITYHQDTSLARELIDRVIDEYETVKLRGYDVYDKAMTVYH